MGKNTIFHESGPGYTTETATQTITNAGGTSVDTEYADFPTKHDYSYSRGENTPNYHKLRQSGKMLPFTPWRQLYSSGYASGVHDVTYLGSPAPGWYNEKIQPYMPFSPTYVPTQEECDEILSTYNYDYEVQRAAADLYGSGHDTLTFLAEIAKLRSLLRQTFENVALLLINGESPNWTIPGDWLSARYGWRTLIFDIESLNEAIAELTGGKDMKYRTERSGSSYSYTESDTTETPHTYGTVELFTQTMVDISVRGSVIADIKPPLFRFNLISTTWELLPFSFVFDWFLNVGQWLHSMSFLLFQEEWKAAGGFKITLTRTKDSEISIWNPDYSGQRIISSFGKTELVVRAPTSIPLLPQTRVRLDEFKYLDVVFLIYQLYRKARSKK